MQTKEMLQTNDKTRAWFTGNQLKYLAAFLMVLDHIYEFILPNVKWLTILGRLVAPVFIYMVAEGMYYTRSRKRYLLQLLIGAEVMYFLNMAVNRIFVFSPIDWDSLAEGVRLGSRTVGNNIFATMFMIALVITVVDWAAKGIKEKRAKQAVLGILAVVSLMGAAYAVRSLSYYVMDLAMEGKVPEIAYEAVGLPPTLFNTEGGLTIILLGVAYYYLRRWRWAQMLALAAVSAYFYVVTHFYSVQWMMVFAAIPLFFYNGKRGKGVNPTFDKWFFYIFYPAHVYALFIIAWLIQR